MSTVSHSTKRIRAAVVEHLALSEAELRERVTSLEGDVVTYRDLLHWALDRLHELDGRERVRVRYVARLRDENRRLRERLARRPAAPVVPLHAVPRSARAVSVQ